MKQSETASPVVGLCQLELHLPGCASLKEKRSRLKPLLARLRREFEVAAAEVGQNDVWQSAVVAAAAVSNDADHLQSELQRLAGWVERHWPDVEVVDAHIDLR